ncbi:hypothetical protein, partial [Aeromonas caviae]|uniref:hypothetical protein n=1 Tax=Aeromonas caviae TaxID=648 RepID=UPI001FBA643F
IEAGVVTLFGVGRIGGAGGTRAIIQHVALPVGPATQGEIVNILLKIKNSFLPTKQILIGL